MNEKMLDCVHYPYIMQIFDVYKQAELTKQQTMDLTDPLFIEESSDEPKK